VPKITILQKIYGANKPEAFQETLNELFKGLKVKAQICGVAPRGWLQIDVSGEDQKFALNYLKKTFGSCPEKLENLTKFSTLQGRIISPEKTRTELHVDIGVFTPKPVDAVISLQNLQAQLLEGKKVSLQKITELFSLTENFPLTVKLCKVDLENGTLTALLSEQQISTFSWWIETFLDRLLVFGAPLSTVKAAVRKAGYARNVVTVESLGLLEQAILCKLGTQAAGLIPKIGRILPHVSLKTFSPRKIAEFRGFK